MADISKITLPSNTTYDIKDTTARSGMVWYGVCNTVANTAAKAVTINGITELTEGLSIRVKMINSVSVASATLNLNSLGAKAITRSAKPSLPAGYTRVLGFSMDNNTYYKITGLKLAGSDAVRFSFSITATCNVFGCYSSSSATNNYSMYATTSSGGQYLRYDGSTYNSYIPSASLGTRFDVVITPHGTSGMPTDSSWTAKTFTASDDMCIGTSSDSATSAKMKGSFYGAFIVDGKFNGIPCERDSDNVLGYYDTYSKTFYEPETGTPTSLGDDTNDYFDNVEAGEWNAGEVLDLVYDGTSWVIVDGAIADEETYGYTKLSSSISSTSKDMAATPSAVKTAYDLAYGKQDALVSGTNIKTINNESLLGSGNIPISAEPEIFWATYETTSYSDISAALSAGKVCAISYYGNVGFLVSSNSEKHVFQFFDSYSCYSLECYSEGYWSLGSGYVQPVINTEGLVKAYGEGVVSAAEAGTDYQTPLTAGTDYIVPPSSPNSGDVLTYNGSAWAASAVPTEIPSQSGNSGKFLKTNGTSVSWASIPNELPSKSGNSGKFLYTDGFDVSWSGLPLDVKVVFYNESYWVNVNSAYNNGIPVFCIANGVISSRDTYYEVPLTYVVYDDSNPEYVHDFYFTCTTEAGTLLTIKLDTNDTWSYTETPISLPSQSGQSGKYLTTDGSALSWGSISVPTASTTTPSMDGTASYGSGTSYARSNHVHPTDTSRQASITANGILEGDGNGTITAATTLSTSSLETYTPSTLGIDTVVTSSSSNLITSGAVYTAINNLDVNSIYFCTYGTTTAAQVKAALTAGKLPVVGSNSNVTSLSYLKDAIGDLLVFSGTSLYSDSGGTYSRFRFSGFVSGAYAYRVINLFEHDDSWSSSTSYLISTTNSGKVYQTNAITAAVTSISSNTTLSSGEYNNLLKCTGSITITIPTGLAVESEIEVMNYGTGTITVAAASGVTLNGTTANSKTITKQYTSAVLKCVDTNEWVIQGAIS